MNIESIVGELLEKRFNELILGITGEDHFSNRSHISEKFSQMVHQEIDSLMEGKREIIKAKVMEAFEQWFEGIEPKFYSEAMISFRNKKSPSMFCQE